jgi:pyruvate dehydrogenase E2 component (dihydrolipoamide acetyltransferase)
MPSVADDPSSATLTAWLVGESGDFVGDQSIATVETSTSLLSIEVGEPGTLIKSLVEPGERVRPGSALAVLGAPGEVIDDVEELMVRLGLEVAPKTHEAGAHLRAVAADDPLRATTWPPHEADDDDEPPMEEKWAAALVEAASAAATIGPDDENVDEPAVVRRVVDWADAMAEAVVGEVVGAVRDPEPGSDTPGAATPQVRLREEIPADELLNVLRAVDGVTLIALVVKAVAVACRRVPLNRDTPSITDVAVRWSTPSGTVAPVVHVAGLMTASSLSATLGDLRARATQGRFRAARMEPASITVVDLGPEGVAEATTSHPAVLTLGNVRAQPLVSGDHLVPGRVLTVALSCNAHRIEAADAARWLVCLAALLEQPLLFLT